MISPIFSSFNVILFSQLLTVCTQHNGDTLNSDGVSRWFYHRNVPIYCLIDDLSFKGLNPNFRCARLKKAKNDSGYGADEPSAGVGLLGDLCESSCPHSRHRGVFWHRHWTRVKARSLRGRCLLPAVCLNKLISTTHLR